MHHDVDLRTSHDMRHLRPCAVCGGLGDRRRMLDHLEAYGLPGLNHGRCVVRRMAQEQLLELPATELDKLSIADTGVRLMKRLLNRSALR